MMDVSISISKCFHDLRCPPVKVGLGKFSALCQRVAGSNPTIAAM